MSARSKSFLLETDPQDIRGNRLTAIQWVQAASRGVMVVIQEVSRTRAQNRIMWDWMNDITKADPLQLNYTKDQYKSCLMVSFGREVQMIQGFNGQFVPHGMSTSALSVGDFSEFLEHIQATAAEYGVTLTKQPDELIRKAKIGAGE